MTNGDHSQSAPKIVTPQPKAIPVGEDAISEMGMEMPLEEAALQHGTFAVSRANIVGLQRQIGNRAVMGLTARKPSPLAMLARKKFAIHRQEQGDGEMLPPIKNVQRRDDVHSSVIGSVHPAPIGAQPKVSRKYLMELQEQAWTGRTGKPEKKALYNAIQQRIQYYNETKIGKTLFDLQADAIALSMVSESVESWIAQYGASKTRSAYIESLRMAIRTEMSIIDGKIMMLNMPERKALPEGAPPAPPPPGGSLPPPVPKSEVSSAPPPPAPRERKLPPPLPDIVPGITPSAPKRLPPPLPDVIPGITPPLPSSAPPSGGVAKLRQQMEAQSQSAPVPMPSPRSASSPRFATVSGATEAKQVAPDPEAKGGPAFGGVVPVVSGGGTNLQNAISAVYLALTSGAIPMDGISENEQIALGALVTQLYKDIEVMSECPPVVSEQVRILELVRVIQSGNTKAIKSQLASLNLNVEDPEEEEKPEGKVVSEDKEAKVPAIPGYLGKQLEKLSKLDQDVMDAVAIQGASKFSAGLANSVTAQKAKAIGKTVVNTAVGAGLSQLPGAGQAYSLVMAVKTVRSTLMHMSNLKKIRVAINEGAAHDKGQFLTDIDYVLSKKKAKAVKSGAGGVPGVGTVKTGIFAIKGMVKKAKGTAGKHRMEVAERMIVRAKTGDAQAKMLVLELVGEDNYIKAIHAADGRDLLAAKMKS